MKKLSRLLLGAAFVCFLMSGFLVWERQVRRRLAFEVDGWVGGGQSGSEDNRPVALVIEDLGIELPVFSAVVEGGRWETTAEGVSYLVGSAMPGKAGNSVFYGHNWPSLLGRLVEAREGQEIVVISSDGEVKRFVITETAVVTPDQTHVLEQTEDARLTVYTCTGFWDRKRYVVVAVPV